jgi:predicted CXXCH cytochrome family protein
MTFLIRTIDHTASGREIVRDRTLEQDTVTIGRSTECDIHLPDLAVEQQHVRIMPAAGGQLRVEAIGTLGFGIDGRTATEATVSTREGAELALGSSLLALGIDDSGTTTITIRKFEEREGKSDVLRGFALASVLPGKRAMSWMAVAAIVLAFLALPIVSHLTRERIDPDNMRAGGVAFDNSWSTGSLSLAHHGLEDNCEACHVDAFVAVRDDTCLSCHAEVGDHAVAGRMADGRKPHEFGEALQWAVADFFGKEGPGACTTCHSEHEGPARMEPASQQFCADCHDSLDTRLTDTELANAHDFGTAHPEFRPAIFTELRRDTVRRISLAENPQEASGIKFPHDLHLDPDGGAAKMAIRLGSSSGYGSPLGCKDCHEASRDRVSFEPISMEDNCEACHSLVYDRVGATYRTLPHGDVEQTLADLRAMDRTPRRPVVSGRSRPGKYARDGLYYSNFGPPVRSLVGVNRALAPGGVCGECHLPATINGKLGVVPINLPDRFLLNGGFDHHAHRQEECSSCHEAATSKVSTDLLLPDLNSCRKCHQGEQARQAEVPSSCAMCHSYHDPGHPLPANKPGQERDMIAFLRRMGIE